MRDYHMHTNYSPDAGAAMRDQFQAAVDAGLTEICLTEHLDLKHMNPIYHIPPDFDKWFAEIEELRPQFPTLRIVAGVEASEMTENSEETLAIVQAHPFDYVLLSRHMVDGVDPSHYDVFLEGRTPEQAYLRYAECVLETVERFPDYDCLAHLGYCSKFAPKLPDRRPFDRDYAPDHVDAILRRVAQDGKALEINTSGLKNGGTSTIPGRDIVKRFIEFGGEFVMFGSDAHYTQYVGYELEYARQLALDCGARYTLTFSGRKGTPIRIEDC